MYCNTEDLYCPVEESCPFIWSKQLRTQTCICEIRMTLESLFHPRNPPCNLFVFGIRLGILRKYQPFCGGGGGGVCVRLGSLSQCFLNNWLNICLYSFILLEGYRRSWFYKNKSARSKKESLLRTHSKTV